MNRLMMNLVIAVGIVGYSTLGWAGMITGNLTKIDDKSSLYYIKDANGMELRFHFDKTTQKTGNLKPGAAVELEEVEGHTKWIKVIEGKK